MNFTFHPYYFNMQNYLVISVRLLDPDRHRGHLKLYHLLKRFRGVILRQHEVQPLKFR